MTPMPSFRHPVRSGARAVLPRVLPALALACAAVVASASSQSGTQPAWHVEEGRLVDASGAVFTVFGDNWHGYDGWYNGAGQPSHKPEGVWADRTIVSMAEQMVDELGYNTMRVPVSMQLLLDDTLPAHADEMISDANAKYRGLTAQASLQLFLADLASAGLKLIPEIHTTQVGQNAGTPMESGYDDDDLLAAHQRLLELTADLGADVIAQGFFNEPHNGAVHAGSAVDADQWDYRAAATRVGSDIVAAGRLFALDCVSEMWPRDARGRPDGDGPYGNQGWGENCYGQARWPIGVDADRVIVMPHFYFESNAGVKQTSIAHWNALLGAESPEGSVAERHCVIIGEWSYSPDGGDSRGSLRRFTEFVAKSAPCGALRWGVSPNQHNPEHALFDDDWQRIRPQAREAALLMREALMGAQR